jgi:hypothetical protein
MLQENGIMSSIITLTILPSGRVRDGQIDQARSRRVLTGCIFPKHNRLAHIKQELEVQLWLHHHVVAHWVWKLTQVIELSIVCHTAIHRPVWWTCSHCVPNVVKIAFFTLHTYRKLKDINSVITGFTSDKLIKLICTGLLTSQNYIHKEIKSWFIQGMLATIQFRAISLPVCHLKT